MKLLQPFVLHHAKKVFKSKAAHAADRRENWSTNMTCCKLLLPHPWFNFLFSPLSSPKFSTTGTEESPKFICGPGIAKLLLCSGSVGQSPLQPISWPCTAMPLLRVRRCARTRGNPSTDRERTVHTNHSTRARQICVSTERRTPGQPCSPSENRSQHSSWGAPDTQETGQHSRGSPLLLTYHKASPWTPNCETVNENAIKNERGKLCTVKSKDTDSFFPSFTWKIRKLEVSRKLNECLV